MKSKRIVFSRAAIASAFLWACLLSSQASHAAASTPFIALRNVSVPEIPAKAAQLVHAAAASDRDQTTQDVLRAVSLMARPGVLPYVVSAICHGSPETAGAVVTTAIELQPQPQDVLYFSKAALCAAPGQVEQIVFSACQAAPVSCADVALLAFRQCPGANNVILAALTRARPDFKSSVVKAEIQVGPNDSEAVIKRAVQLFNDPARVPAK